MKYSLFSLLMVFVLLSAFGCKKPKVDEPGANFQKGDMLTHMADQIILPKYELLKIKFTTLKSDWENYEQNSNAENLSIVRDSWKESVLAFHAVKVYEFGPAADIAFRSSIGTFPTDTSKVLANIENGNANLSASENTDAIGLSALEFLLFHIKAEERMSNINGYKSYIDLLITKMENEMNSVLNTWKSSYAAKFKTSTGTESTSAFSLMVNEFNKEYELAKNAKLGIPLGKQSLGVQRSEYIEAPYSRYSLRILKENVIQIQQLFQGNGRNGTTNLGFDDYLIALDRKALVDEINGEINAILSDLNQLNDDLVMELQNRPAQLDQLYTKMHNLVVHFKTDMTSAFGILITYQDNDGD
jgi:predicted lipoprotein